MANNFLKATKIAAAALGLLEREIVLPRLVWRFAEADFRGAANDTLTLRLPAVTAARDYEFRTRTNPIVVDDLVEKAVNVTLNKHPYNAVAVTDEQLTLDITDFGEQVLQPQVRAVAERQEGYIATAMDAAPIATVLEAGEDDDPYKVLLRARAALNARNVPLSDRMLVLGANVDTWVLGSDRLSKVDQSGSDGALREARIGRIAGFEGVVSNAIDPDVAYAFHRTAFAFATVAPVVPDGANYGNSRTYNGLAMRWIRDYDPNYLRDRSVVSAFAGVSSVNDGLADIDEDGAEDDAANIRAVRINFTPAA